MYEHGKVTSLSISSSNGTFENMTTKDKDDNHSSVTKGVAKTLRTNFNDVFGFDTLTEEDNLDKWFLVAESNLPEKEGISIVEKFEDVFSFEVMSEKDNLDNWLLNAEFNSFKDRTKKNLTKIGDKSSSFHDFFCDTEFIRLTVKENRFVSANGVEIKENENISKDFRALLNCLVDQEQNTEITGDENNIKGMVGADRKTIVEIIEYEERRTKSS